MKIYTKTGDRGCHYCLGYKRVTECAICKKAYTCSYTGTSSLYNGERRDKDDLIFEALGTTDELTSHLGLALEFCEEGELISLCEQIQWVQCCLQDIGSNVATPRERSNDAKKARTTFDPDGNLCAQLERWIDEMDTHLPQLTQFILPSGGRASASLHVARTVCRRAERRLQPLVRSHLCDESTAIYLNRLSDYLFTAARFAAMKQGKKEKIYKKQS